MLRLCGCLHFLQLIHICLKLRFLFLHRFSGSLIGSQHFLIIGRHLCEIFRHVQNLTQRVCGKNRFQIGNALLFIGILDSFLQAEILPLLRRLCLLQLCLGGRNLFVLGDDVVLNLFQIIAHFCKLAVQAVQFSLKAALRLFHVGDIFFLSVLLILGRFSFFLRVFQLFSRIRSGIYAQPWDRKHDQHKNSRDQPALSHFFHPHSPLKSSSLSIR